MVLNCLVKLFAIELGLTFLKNRSTVLYSMICVMMAVPTVLPPSRTVNRWPLSTASGWRSSHLNSTLSPGMTILLSLSSVPSGQKRPQGSST